MKRMQYIVVRNSLIRTPGYAPEKRLEVALLACAMQRPNTDNLLHQTAWKSYAHLKQLSGIRSNTTLRKAIWQMEQAGIVKVVHNYRTKAPGTAALHDKNSYVIDYYFQQMSMSIHGYTLIPRELLSIGLTNAQFAVALVLYMYAGSTGCAWPSINHLAELLGLARSTVCLALWALRKKNMFVRILRRYMGLLRGGKGHKVNNYFPTNSPFAGRRKNNAAASCGGALLYGEASSPYGSPNIGQQGVTNNSRKGFIKRERKRIGTDGRSNDIAEPPQTLVIRHRKRHLARVRRRLSTLPLAPQGGSAPFWGQSPGNPGPEKKISLSSGVSRSTADMLRPP